MSLSPRWARGRGGWRLPRVTLWLAATLAGLFLAFGAAPEALLYDRQAIQDGELWRLLTGHLIHADAVHLAWNLAAFVVLGALYETMARPSAARYLGLLLAGAVAIDAWLWWVEPGWSVYCGLSGLLNGLFAAVALALWRATRNPLALLLLAGDFGKIAFEAAQGGALLATSSWSSVPGAHLAGLAAGLILWLATQPDRLWAPRPRNGY
jgi:rhomboid family GlyGly-CTERM serine protease